jgi:hypothetical protein
MAPEKKGGVMGGLLADSMRRLRHIVDESTQDRPSVNSISDLRKLCKTAARRQRSDRWYVAIGDHQLRRQHEAGGVVDDRLFR